MILRRIFAQFRLQHTSKGELSANGGDGDGGDGTVEMLSTSTIQRIPFRSIKRICHIILPMHLRENEKNPDIN